MAYSATPKFNPFQSSVVFLTEIIHLFCSVKQMTGFYMKCKAGLKWVLTILTFSLQTHFQK